MSILLSDGFRCMCVCQCQSDIFFTPDGAMSELSGYRDNLCVLCIVWHDGLVIRRSVVDLSVMGSNP